MRCSCEVLCGCWSKLIQASDIKVATQEMEISSKHLRTAIRSVCVSKWCRRRTKWRVGPEGKEYRTLEGRGEKKARR